jgi:hypothetical protein
MAGALVFEDISRPGIQTGDDADGSFGDMGGTLGVVGDDGTVLGVGSGVAMDPTARSALPPRARPIPTPVSAGARRTA